MSFARFKLENKLGRKLYRSEIATRDGAEVRVIIRLDRKICNCKFCGRSFLGFRRADAQRTDKFCEVCNSNKIAMEFSLKDLCDIWNLRKSGLTLPAIADKYGCGKSRIHGILPKFDKFYKIDYYKELIDEYIDTSSNMV